MDTEAWIRGRTGELFMNAGDENEAADKRLNETLAAQQTTRRPASWVSESELRRGAHRRNIIYLSVAAVCMLLFVVLIHLLLERTRGTAVAPDLGIHASP